jgi:hypothetical protein
MEIIKSQRTELKVCNDKLLSKEIMNLEQAIEREVYDV